MTLPEHILAYMRENWSAFQADEHEPYTDAAAIEIAMNELRDEAVDRGFQVTTPPHGSADSDPITDILIRTEDRQPC